MHENNVTICYQKSITFILHFTILKVWAEVSPTFSPFYNFHILIKWPKLITLVSMDILERRYFMPNKLHIMCSLLQLFKVLNWYHLQGCVLCTPLWKYSHSEVVGANLIAVSILLQNLELRLETHSESQTVGHLGTMTIFHSTNTWNTFIGPKD